MFSKRNIKDIPVEETSHASGSRKLLVSKNDTTSSYFEAFTYGDLPSNKKWEMHKHNNIIEICLVVKGNGVIRDIQGNEEKLSKGDRFIFSANTSHEIENTEEEVAEFYFFRVQNK